MNKVNYKVLSTGSKMVKKFSGVVSWYPCLGFFYQPKLPKELVRKSSKH